MSDSATDSLPCSFGSDCLVSIASSSELISGPELELSPKFADVLLLLLLKLATSSRGRQIGLVGLVSIIEDLTWTSGA